MDLYNSLKGLGPPQNVANTIKRVQANTNWNDFVTNYPFNGTHLNPHTIKKIVDKYYQIDEEERKKWKQAHHDKEDAERKKLQTEAHKSELLHQANSLRYVIEKNHGAPPGTVPDPETHGRNFIGIGRLLEREAEGEEILKETKRTAAEDAKIKKAHEKYLERSGNPYYGDHHGGGKTKRRMHRKSKKLRKRKSKKNSKK
jgi:hypothetical protein